MSPKFDWEWLAKLIVMLSMEAAKWYRLINSDEAEIARAQRAVSIVLDPARPETTVDDVRANGF